MPACMCARLVCPPLLFSFPLPLPLSCPPSPFSPHTAPLLCSSRPRSIHDGKAEGVYITSPGTKGRLEGCTIAGNMLTGVEIRRGADPLFSSCRCASPGPADSPACLPPLLRFSPAFPRGFLGDNRRPTMLPTMLRALFFCAFGRRRLCFPSCGQLAPTLKGGGGGASESPPPHLLGGGRMCEGERGGHIRAAPPGDRGR